MPVNQICVRLGDLHEIFKAVCAQQEIEPQQALKEVISEFTLQADTKNFSATSSNLRIRFNAGEFHKPYIEVCKSKKITASAMLRRLVQNEILLKISNSTEKNKHNSITHTNEIKAITGLHDPTRIRLELRLSQSEFDVLNTLAQPRKISVQKLIEKIIRAFLVKSNVLSKDEIVTLGGINLSLMRCGNNLNQIAKQLNISAPNLDGFQELKEELSQCIFSIEKYVRECSALLEQSNQRWALEQKA